MLESLTNSLIISAQTISLASEAEDELRALSQQISAAPSPSGMGAALMLLEETAHLGRDRNNRATQIENILVDEFETSAANSKTNKSIGRLNTLLAMEHAVVKSNTPLSISKLQAIHRDLFIGTELEDMGGHFRMKDKPMGAGRFHSFESSYAPPSAQDVPALMEALVAFCNSTTLSPILHAAIAHAYCIEVAGFTHGNGNVARILIQYLLHSRGVLEAGVIPISLSLGYMKHSYRDYLERFCNVFRSSEKNLDKLDTETYGESKPQKRIDESFGVRKANRNVAKLKIENDMTPCILDREDIEPYLRLFSKACKTAAQSSRAFLDKCANIAEHSERVLDVRSDSASLLIIHELPGMPVLNVQTASDRIGRSFKRVSSAFAELEKRGIIRQITKGKRNRVFVAPDIIEAFQSAGDFH